MKNILLFALPFLGENIYYISSVRKFYRQKLICKMLPAVFVNFIKIIFSSFLAKKKNKDMSYHIIILTLFFETFAILNAVYSTRLTGIHNAIALNSKFIFIALLSFVMLKKKFTIMQMIGQSIILGGILYSGYSSKSDNDIKSTYTHFTFLAIICSGFMSSLGNVYFEKYIRHRIIDFHTYNMEYASTHLFVSLFTETVELLLGGISRIGSTVSNYKFYNFIFVSCFHTSLLTWISTKIEPVIRSFLFLIVTTTTSIVIDYMESGSVKTSNIITLLAVNVGILCYETENVKKIIKKLISKKEK